MADKLAFALVSPERELFRGEVEHVVVPGAEGEFGVLPGHAPMISIVKPGVLSVLDGASSRRIFVNGGFADVTPEGLTVLAEEAIDLERDAPDPAALEAALKDAQEDWGDASSDDQRALAAAKIARLEALRAAIAPRH